jgi:uncharacterized OB-fold protein
MEAPYVIAIVDLDDGWTMLTNIVDHDDVDLTCGQRVHVSFVDVDDGATVPCFTPE